MINEVLQDSREASFSDRDKETHFTEYLFSNLSSESRRTSRHKYETISSQVGEDLVKSNLQIR